jgi:ubiquinone/menaquinone biosynthesis C-methylase UbiE/uncharacterized protein YbaR (Trm112 family)
MIAGFPARLLPLVRSPQDGSPLSVCSGTVPESGYIREGMVQDCSGNQYPIQEGILRLLNVEALAPLEQQERTQRDNEAARYNNRLAARYYREVLPFVSYLGLTRDDVVLELAAGTGRITTEIAGNASALVATDFSYASLATTAQSLPPDVEVALVEADSVVFPGAAGAFSLVLSAQFIEHIPTRERRTQHAASLAALCAPMGRVIVSAYHHDIRRRWGRKPVEGTHPNGVFFHFFSRRELMTLFGPQFSRVRVTYMDAVLPGSARFIASERILGTLSSLWVRTPLCLFAHLIVVRATGTPHHD